MVGSKQFLLVCGALSEAFSLLPQLPTFYSYFYRNTAASKEQCDACTAAFPSRYILMRGLLIIAMAQEAER